MALLHGAPPMRLVSGWAYFNYKSKTEPSRIELKYRFFWFSVSVLILEKFGVRPLLRFCLAPKLNKRKNRTSLCTEETIAEFSQFRTAVEQANRDPHVPQPASYSPVTQQPASYLP